MVNASNQAQTFSDPSFVHGFYLLHPILCLYSIVAMAILTAMTFVPCLSRMFLT